MIRNLFLLLLPGFLVSIAGCGGDTTEAAPRPKALPVPEVTFTITDLTADVHWSLSGQVGNVRFTYELYAGDAGTPEVTATTSETSRRFDLEPGVAYRFRVRAVAPVGSANWTDSAFSGFATFLAGGSVEPDPELDLGLPVAGEADGVLRAFPGAEGGGMYTTGGRGGTIYHVTNLNDSGAGSFRDAVSKPNRIIVFDVAGTIALNSKLKITSSNLTIAGQTAPGDGICLRNHTVELQGDNIIIRYLRFRMGDTTATEDDALGGRYHSNIIVDHCSMSWSTDECVSLYANRNFTLQWCVISESLCNSVHEKGKHGYGGIWGGKNASYHHNLLAHHVSRNPRFDHPYVYQNNNATYIEQYNGNIDYRNNAVYNWGESENSYGGELCKINMVNNYYKEGPASKSNSYFFVTYGNCCSNCVGYGYTYEQIMPRIYADGNLYLKKDGSQAAFSTDNYTGIYDKDKKSYTTYANDDTGTFRQQALLPIVIDGKPCYTSTHSASDAFERITGFAGASLARDAVDKRAVQDALSGSATCTDGGNGSKNGIIDTQSAVGGWPELTATDEEKQRAATDTDGDGIPDYYEDLLGLDPNDPSDANAMTLDPQGIYPNIEVYFHYLVKDITAAQTAGGVYTKLQ